MSERIIIPRKKSKSIKISLLMLFVIIIESFLIYVYFFKPKFITGGLPPLALIICCMIILPIIIFCFIEYVKDIFEKGNILEINENGIIENITRLKVGLIKWNDIKQIKLYPTLDNIFLICIQLKNPEQYITNKKTISKINRKKKETTHINFSSIYFKKEAKDVMNLIQLYINRNLINENF